MTQKKKTQRGRLSAVRSNELLSGLHKMASLAKRSHYYCEDGWYSCPLAEDGCFDDQFDKDKCNCGADEHNKQVDELLKSLTR